ncbi:GNAT family N-acetyltransferase [Hyphococcus sp. DH-69]|uniref:GNAT family N-acetyltransferase n=1 Tax=Hyphococcus formosus TaxID=3143534 RepID=UPI00398B4616
MGTIDPDQSDIIAAPERMTSAHDVRDFDCGIESLNSWLNKRALANNNRTSQTFVIQQHDMVIGYYSLAAGSIDRSSAAKKLSRNSVDPIPVIVLGRLAVDKAHHGKGLGADLLRDALLRSVRASKEIGIRAILVHAIDDAAAAFYRRFNFLESPIQPRTLMLPLDAVAALLRR